MYQFYTNLCIQSYRCTNFIICRCIKSKYQAESTYMYWARELARIVMSWNWTRFFNSKCFMSSTQIFMSQIWAKSISFGLHECLQIRLFVDLKSWAVGPLGWEDHRYLVQWDLYEFIYSNLIWYHQNNKGWHLEKMSPKNSNIQVNLADWLVQFD
jgi:hypothetical protein